MNKIAILISFLFCSLSLHAHELEQIDPNGYETHDSVGSLQPTEFSANFPDIELLDQRNQPVELKTLFNNEKDVIFAFFFTHCVSVCTTITLSLKSMQADLPPGTLITMISIDPETDTPELLGSYAQQHRIDDPDWYLLTGDNKKIVDFQKNFEAYRGNKMNHSASLFVKKSNSNVITEFTNNFSDIPGFLTNHFTNALN